MISFSGVNWLGVIVGTVVSMAMGALWYGPLFGQLWLKMIGKSEDELEADAMDYVKTAVAAFIAMLVLNMAIIAFGASGFLAGLLVGAVTFIGFGATATYVYTTFEGPPEKVWLLYAAYQLVVYLIMGVVFAIW
jgi:hypothetical protein